MQGAVKGTRHYRYYVSRGLVRGSVQDERRGWRVSAPELERAVRAATQQILSDRAAIAGAIEELNIDAHRLPSIFKVAEAWIQSLRSEAEAASALTRLIERVGPGRTASRFLSNCRSRPMKGVMSRLRTNPR